MRRIFFAASIFATIFFSNSVLSAAQLATASYDTDSYINFKTNNEDDQFITVGTQNPGPHWVFGGIEFSSLGTATGSGDKFLVLEAGEKTGTFGSAYPAAVNVVALTDSLANYYSSADPHAWIQANVTGQTVLATLDFSDPGEIHSADITTVVNGWLANPATNFGFALFGASGNADLISSDYNAVNSGTPGFVAKSGPYISDIAVNVPEPTTVVLLGLGLIGVGIINRRK